MRYVLDAGRIGRAVCVLIITLLVSLLCTSIRAATINVPDDQPSIQGGIDAAVSGDTVLVAPGHYVENINFKGKELVVSSHFLLDNDPDYIFNTVIDGSEQNHPDTGTTVLMVSGEGPETVLQGFTITGGSGTRHEWSAGHFDKMGGGIFVQGSTATIQYNYIQDNVTAYEAGLYAAGGGGMMIQNATGYVRNNIIVENGGRYGAGMAVGYSATIITNNVIAYNYGGEKYGGSGIQMNQGYTYIENNTIVGNLSDEPGGGLRAFGGTQTIQNNIIWYNEAPSDSQLYGVTAVNYCNVQGGWPTGGGIIDVEPCLSKDHWLYPFEGSPGVDAGDPTAQYDDIENPSLADSAYWPSFGGLTNDMGAYGGPGAFPFHKVAFHVDTMLGWPPFDASFSAYSRETLSEWRWSFGDGDSSTGQTVMHTYDQPGVFDVSLSVPLGGGGTYTFTRDDLIIALADTLKADSVRGSVSGTVEVGLMETNAAPIKRLIVPVEYNGDCPLSLQSWSTVGCRTEEFEIDTLHMDTVNQRFVLALEDVDGEMLEPGSGAILKLAFLVNASCAGGDIVPIQVDGYDTWLPRFECPAGAYEVPTVPGEVTIGCCGTYTGGFTGNANCDDQGKLNLSDITVLVTRVYLDPATPLCCEENGDVNCDTKINLSDITNLTTRVYLDTAYPLCECM